MSSCGGYHELMWQVVNKKVDGFDKVLQLWRHGGSKQLVLGVGDYLVTMTSSERIQLAMLLLADEAGT